MQRLAGELMALHCLGKLLGSPSTLAELAADTKGRCQAPSETLAECPARENQVWCETVLSCLMSGDARHQGAEPVTGPLQLSGCCRASGTMHQSCCLALPVQQWTLLLCSRWPLLSLPLCLGQHCLACLYWCERHSFFVAWRASQPCQKPDHVTQPVSRGLQISPGTG